MVTSRFARLGVLLAGCSTLPSAQPPPDDRPDASVAGDAAPSPDAIAPLQDPGGVGPWHVGIHTVELTDPARNRKFSVDVWYPIDPATTSGTPNLYKLDSFLGTLASIESPARRDATPAAGTWPVVLFSHGFGGIRFQSYFVTEQLASHGMVVVAPDHPGNTLLDFTQLGNDAAAAQSAIDRPLDLIYTLDAALAGGLGVELSLDPAHVAATGHSFGGWTCLETARRDPRIRAVFPMAPGFRNGATDDFVAMLARPLLYIGGSADHTCDFPANQQDPYDKSAMPKYLLEVTGAGHLDFSNLCEVALAKQFIHDGCDATKIDPEIVHARVNRVATAFALRYLRDDPRYDAFLDPAAIAALGNVEFWATP